MKPLYMKVKGSWGLYLGMGIDEITINLEHLSGLVSLAGENGRAKTTFMELMSPFAIFPSRKKKDPKRYNYKKQFRFRDSFVEKAYLHNGSVYIFRVDIPAGTTMSPEGTVQKDGEFLYKDTKIGQYKKTCAEIFGSEELFYSGIFSCQGGMKITDLTPGEFKKLLIEILGLSKYEKYWHTCKDVLKILHTKLSEVEIKLEGLKKTEAERKDSSLKLFAYMEDKDLVTKNISEHKKALEVFEKELLSLRENKASNEKIDIQVKALSDKKTDKEAAFASLVSDQKGKQSDIQKEIDDKFTNLAPYQEIIGQKNKILAAGKLIASKEENVKDLKKDIPKIQEETRDLASKMDKARDTLFSEREKLKDLEHDEQMETLKTKHDELNLELEKFGREKLEIVAIIDSYGSDKQLELLKSNLARIIESEKLLSVRPDMCTIDDCPYIKDTVEKCKDKKTVEAAIPARENEIATLIIIKDQELANIEAAISGIAKDIAEKHVKMLERKTYINDQQEIFTKNISSITGIGLCFKRDHDHHTKTIEKYHVKIEAEETEIELLAEFSSKKDKLKMAEELFDRESAMITELRVGLKKEAEKEEKSTMDHEAAKYVIKEEITGLEASKITNVDMMIEFKGNAIGNSKIDLAKSERLLESAIAIIAIEQEKAKKSEEYRKEYNETVLIDRDLRQQISEWEYIRAGVSKSGLQALEIAASAPLFNKLANELLFETYGGVFSVELITKDPETDAEILDILVTRTDRGEERTFFLSDYSGGQSVWLLQSLKSAQILVNAEKSGIEFKSCYADEESGALSRNYAERFINMYRALIKKGNFDVMFFITHIPECQAMADHSLIFEEGGIVSESMIEMN